MRELAWSMTVASAPGGRRALQAIRAFFSGRIPQLWRLPGWVALSCLWGLGSGWAAQTEAAAGSVPSLPQTAPFSIEARVQACVGCHGKEGRATPDGYFPRIAGKPEEYLYQQLLHFREGRRRYALMTGLLDTLSDDYLREIARYFAGLSLPYPPPAPGVVPGEVWQRGEKLVRLGDATRQIPACVQCHGERLTGVQPATPGLLGLSRDYVNGQLGAWKNGQRRSLSPDCMADIASRLTTADVGAVSAWLAAQPVPSPAQAANTLPARALPLKCGAWRGVAGR